LEATGRWLLVAGHTYPPHPTQPLNNFSEHSKLKNSF